MNLTLYRELLQGIESVFLTSRAVVPVMLEQGRGKIVNISSRAGLAGRPTMAPYSVAKSAVIRLTESLAAELKDQGINVNCLLPDTIDTPQNRQSMPDIVFSFQSNTHCTLKTAH